MDGTWFARRVAAAGGLARRLHSLRVLAQQRLHLAAFLILCAALPLHAQNSSDISFDPAITQAEFQKFAHLVAQGIYASPVSPARAGGLLGFDVGVAATLVPVDESASYWTRSVHSDLTTVSDYVAVPRVVASKGFVYGTVSGTYAKVQSSDIKVIGGAVDIPIINGGLIKPTLALRGAYSQLSGADVFDQKVYGVELFLSKGIGPFTPYGAIGRMRADSEGVIPASGSRPEIRLKDNSDLNRYTVGVRLSLLLPKITVEATQAEVRSYTAKVSFGF